jgi:hypothetical protein
MTDPKAPTSPPHDHRLEGLGSSSVRSEPGSTGAVAGTCFECGCELHAPFCPACNPEMVGGVDPWWPIDTAPRDGSRVLLWQVNGPHAYATTGSFREYLPGAPDWRGSAGTPFTPTHWMPLPEPPEGV